MQAGTLRSQLNQATADAAEAKANEEALVKSAAELKEALEKRPEPAVRLSNPQARAWTSTSPDGYRSWRCTWHHRRSTMHERPQHCTGRQLCVDLFAGTVDA